MISPRIKIFLVLLFWFLCSEERRRCRRSRQRFHLLLLLFVRARQKYFERQKQFRIEHALRLFIRHGQPPPRKLLRGDLVDTGDAPLKHLLLNGSRGGLVSIFGFDRPALKKLKKEFSPRFNEAYRRVTLKRTLESYAMKLQKECITLQERRKLRAYIRKGRDRLRTGRLSQRGRKRTFSTTMALCCTLVFLRSRMDRKFLSLLSGIVPSVVNLVVDVGVCALRNTLRDMKEGQIRWPTVEEMDHCATMVNNKERYLHGVWGFVDGLNTPVENHKDPDIQEAYYNGWLSGTYVSCVIVFSSDGLIRWVNFNCPGSWHDAKIARGLYVRLRDECPDGFLIVADSAFPTNKTICEGKIRRTLKEPEKQALVREICKGDVDAMISLAETRVVTSARQSAEWGMGGIQSSFPRITCKMSIAEDGRRVILYECILRLFQYRTHTVEGSNQIRSVYTQSLNKNVGSSEAETILRRQMAWQG